MNRTNIYLSDEQKERLQSESDRTGLSVSEIIRRATDHWLDYKSHPLERMAEEFFGDETSPPEPTQNLGRILDLVRQMDKRLTLLIYSQPDAVKKRMESRASELWGTDPIFDQVEE